MSLVHTILVVDDDDDIREMVLLILGSAGYAVIGVADGREALTCLEHTPVDLVVTDLEMPRCDGYTLCRTIRADNRHQALPIVVMTARPRHAVHIDEALDVGFVQKPFQPKLLLTAVATEIGARRP